jgi:hypothetical protein
MCLLCWQQCQLLIILMVMPDIDQVGDYAGDTLVIIAGVD